MKTPAAICLITPSQLCSAPRVVKEADALSEAGYAVTVISTRNTTVADPLDEAVLRAAFWKSRRVDLLRGMRPLRVAAQRMARAALGSGRFASTLLAAVAENEAFPLLLREARRVRPQMYIGHCLTGLAAGYHAAAGRGTKLGFDAEDYHEAELMPAQMGQAGVRAARVLQSAAWPKLSHLTAAAPLISKHLGHDYGREPAVVLNVFPKSMVPPLPPEARPPHEPVRLYWFSQTIGPGRGLEQLVDAIVLLEFPVELHLRGYDEGGFAEKLRHKLQASGRGHLLIASGLAMPDEMARLAAECDIGLGLEQTEPFNRGICLTNKIFIYLLAGIPMVLSNTPAHREMIRHLGHAAILTDMQDHRDLASAIATLAEDRKRGGAAAAHAWQLGQSRFNWDEEKSKLVESVRAALAGH